MVALSGEYLVDEEVVVRNRPFEGSSGFEVITPFRLDDGSVFMVDRGWIAQASDGRPSEFAAPPSGHVEVEARLKAGEERIAGRTSTGIEFATIDLDELAERVGEPSYTGAYGVLVQSGADADEPPLAAARPVRDEGPHLSYALQWFVFAALAFVGLGWAANQERRGLAEASGAAPEAGTPTRRSATDGATQAREDRRRRRPRGRGARPRRRYAHASSMSSWYSRLQWSSVPSGMISTRSGFSASTAPGSCETSTTEPS